MLKSPVGAVIFDMDGLLFDTERVALETYREAAAGLAIARATDELFITFVGRNWKTTQVLMSAALGPDDTARMLEAWPPIFRDRVDSLGVPQKPGARAILDFVRGRGFLIALATSAGGPKARRQLEGAGLIDHFSAIASGDEVVHGKPAPDLYLLAAERLGVVPETCVALEDSEAGVEAASAAGMRVIMVPDLKQPSERIRALATRVAASLVDVREYFDGCNRPDDTGLIPTETVRQESP
jgi:HAD superfamily hydrolase (TIGR01509 family)